MSLFPQLGTSMRKEGWLEKKGDSGGVTGTRRRNSNSR